MRENHGGIFWANEIHLLDERKVGLVGKDHPCVGQRKRNLINLSL